MREELEKEILKGHLGYTSHNKLQASVCIKVWILVFCTFYTLLFCHTSHWRTTTVFHIAVICVHFQRYIFVFQTLKEAIDIFYLLYYDSQHVAAILSWLFILICTGSKILIKWQRIADNNKSGSDVRWEAHLKAGVGKTGPNKSELYKSSPLSSCLPPKPLPQNTWAHTAWLLLQCWGEEEWWGAWFFYLIHK